MKISVCRFERAACRPEDEPRTGGPAVTFVGRSNVGKSSLINRLLGVRGLARTSSTPGRTQSVNFYRVNESFWFVDLPGYGWAAAPARVRAAWRPMVEGFLSRWGARTALAVLVLDARHGPTDLDETMRDWLEAAGLAWTAAATKADKLSARERASAQRTLRAWSPGPDGDGPFLVSARTGLGIRDVWRRLDRALVAPEGRDRGRPWISAN